MPSGAKKRKAAKKKAQKQAHNSDGSHLQGIDETKSHDERESDGERESSEERGVSRKNEEGEQNVAEFSKEAKLKENYDDDDEVRVNIEGDVRGNKNGKHKSSSSSSSGSSSDDDEIAVEKEKSVVSEVHGSLPKASRENPVISEAAYDSVEESIPVEESVKQVVSSPQELKTGSESADVEDQVITHVIESEKKQNLDEVLSSAGEKQTVSPGVTEFLQEKIEKKIIQAQEGPRNQSESADITARNGEGLPQSSGVTSADACFEDNHVKESETQKYVEDQPLAPSAPLPVRRTSLMNCCGLLEVFSGGASR
ncbi:pre-mRNA-splicing factor SPP381-like [Chenopodium quinoa]|uniref:pre-mRNA-splicing factor SPP381-like n=1 Tax=Chenopodium quinoa TaxID=63459 RepID=UPI000B76F571|nr:pre-mRNA-splicing factor SPP381-like [Chenopodium quinoa]